MTVELPKHDPEQTVRQRIGDLALTFMDDLTETFGEDVEVDVLAITCMVTFQKGETMHNGSFFRCEDGRVWVQEALFTQAATQAGNTPSVSWEDDDD